MIRAHLAVHRTIRDNVVYRKVGATNDQILTAAQAAHVDQFVRPLLEAMTQSSTTTP